MSAHETGFSVEKLYIWVYLCRLFYVAIHNTTQRHNKFYNLKNQTNHTLWYDYVYIWKKKKLNERINIYLYKIFGTRISFSVYTSLYLFNALPINFGKKCNIVLGFLSVYRSVYLIFDVSWKKNKKGQGSKKRKRVKREREWKGQESKKGKKVKGQDGEKSRRVERARR